MKILITGGAGFIGSNAAARWLARGAHVVILDDLSRRGTPLNLRWLQSLPGHLTFERLNLADIAATDAALARQQDVNAILHLAGQVAVTSSVRDPRDDFNSNALGTFNLLESVRAHAPHATLVYASTNKVYGGMEDVGIVEREGRYLYRDLPHGVDESHQLDFHSPYGCSKGAADQYVRDYYRIFGLKTVVFRQSCIYGYRQFGVEDQGWIAWFMIATLLGEPIKVYGDGRQVRDVLFIDDLLDAYDAAITRIDSVAGEVFNVGGGSANCVSLIELLEFIRDARGEAVPHERHGWRPGDQRCFIGDTRKAARQLGWSPRVGWRDGFDRLYRWIYAHRDEFAEARRASLG